MKNERWQEWAMGLLGLWLVLSPWSLHLMGFEAPLAGAPFWSTMITGLLVALLGVGALSTPMMWEDWGDLAAGAWLIASPWVLGFTDQTYASWNVWICGIAIFALAIWGLYRRGESPA